MTKSQSAVFDWIVFDWAVFDSGYDPKPLIMDVTTGCIRSASFTSSLGTREINT